MKRSAQGILALTSVFTLLSACATDADDELLELESNKPKASLQIKDPRWLLGQTSTKSWSLDKTGSVDTSARTVTWNLAATQSATASRDLVLGGRVVLKNTGHAPATIGNVVIVLEKKTGNKWNAISRVIANETYGDAATIAKVAKSNSQSETMVEDAASGYLVTSFAPVPAKGQRPLDFAATFDNDVLGLLPGTKVRAQIYVTYGNAGSGPSNVDIDGNGTIGQDEQKIDTESETFDDRAVPWPYNVNAQVELEDTLADITTTGTVTFSNAQFNLGATTGTVTVSYAGGTDGGTIENCGHLVGLGVDITDCDTQTIAPEFAWRDGDLTTYSQTDWGANGAAASTLVANYFSVYPSTQVVIGRPGGSITFDNPNAILAYAPSSGANLPLIGDYTNPPSSVGGEVAGDILALELNVSFSSVFGGTSSVDFGDVYVCELTTHPLLSGKTVAQILDEANTALAGGVASYNLVELQVAISQLNRAFEGGTVSTFATDHLSPTPCP